MSDASERPPHEPSEGPAPSGLTMQCPICERILPASDAFQDTGMCEECAEALAKIPDAEGLEETDAELRAAIARYQKRQAYMRAYNERPDVREARKGYNQRRRERDAQLIKRARELGLL